MALFGSNSNSSIEDLIRENEGLKHKLKTTEDELSRVRGENERLEHKLNSRGESYVDIIATLVEDENYHISEILSDIKQRLEEAVEQGNKILFEALSIKDSSIDAGDGIEEITESMTSLMELSNDSNSSIESLSSRATEINSIISLIKILQNKQIF